MQVFPPCAASHFSARNLYARVFAMLMSARDEREAALRCEAKLTERSWLVGGRNNGGEMENAA